MRPPLIIATYPTVAVKNRVKQIHSVIVFGIAVMKQIEKLAACIPYRGRDEVKQTFAFVVEGLEGTVIR